jgi:hypothetical protein
MIAFGWINPIKAIYWSVMLDGVMAVPTMATMMLLATRSDAIGRFATIITPAAVLAILATSFGMWTNPPGAAAGWAPLLRPDAAESVGLAARSRLPLVARL